MMEEFENQDEELSLPEDLEKKVGDVSFVGERLLFELVCCWRQAASRTKPRELLVTFSPATTKTCAPQQG